MDTGRDRRANFHVRGFALGAVDADRGVPAIEAGWDDDRQRARRGMGNRGLDAAEANFGQLRLEVKPAAADSHTTAFDSPEGTHRRDAGGGCDLHRYGKLRISEDVGTSGGMMGGWRRLGRSSAERHVSSSSMFQ